MCTCPSSEQVDVDPTTLAAAFFKPRRYEQESSPAIFDQAIRHTVYFEGTEIPVWSWGEGPRVLLAHGWESRSYDLVAFIDSFVKAGFAVTTYDSPGHGLASGDETNATDMGDAMQAVAGIFNRIDAVVAHSLGSLAALWAFQNGLKVTCSIHINGPSSLESTIEIFAQRGKLKEDLYAQFRECVIDRMYSSTNSLRTSDLAKNLTHPGLLVHDIEDGVIPFEESIRLAGHWKSSTLLPALKVGHKKVLSDAATVDMCTLFLKQNLPNQETEFKSDSAI